MTKTTGPTEMVRYLSRKLIPLSTGIGLLIAVLAPVTFWFHAHLDLHERVSLYAEDLAGNLRQVVQESPALWKYQTYKFITITEGFHPAIDVSGFRILDEKGELISGHDYYKAGWKKPGENLSFTEDIYSTLGIAPIMFNNRRVGTVEVLADDKPIVRTSALLLCFSSLVGIALAVLVYRFPVKVVRKMDGEIGELIVNLRSSEGNYRSLNAELELKVEERTSELVDAQGKLIHEEKLAMLGRIAGNMGNELRNPLGVMSNAVFFLQTVVPDADETIREYLEIIGKEIDKSQCIISELLDYCSGRPPRTEPVAVHELISQSREKCAIPETIRFQVDLPETLPNVLVDLLQMEKVFQHLISNAVQAMPNGGALRITAQQVRGVRKDRETRNEESRKVLGSRNEERGNKEINLNPRSSILDADFVEISVADTGEGIAPENIEKFFQPLISTKSRGIGLGLAVCRNLTEANGGRIWVESEQGKGSTFYFTMRV